jgi:hypothetical protein
MGIDGVLEASTGVAVIGVLILVIVAGCIYMLPTIVGATRKVVNIGSVAAINLLLGWTLIGWAVALAMALRTNPPHAYPQYWAAPGQPPVDPPLGPPPPGWYPDPAGTGRMLWWNGSQWASAPMAPPTDQPPSP